MSKLDLEQVKLHFCALGIADIDAIIAIEEAVYAHPWTRGNFLDSFYIYHQLFLAFFLFLNNVILLFEI